MAEDRTLLHEDFTAYDLGTVPNSYSPWGEYHCRTDQGRLGEWIEATTHHSWRQSLGGRAGCWRVAEDNGRQVLEQTLYTENSYPLIVTGDEHWREYRMEADIRPLSFAAPCGIVVGYQHSRDFFALLIDDDALRLVRRRHDRLLELGFAAVQFDVDSYRRIALVCGRDRIRAFVDGDQLFEAPGDEFSGGRVGLIANAPVRFADITVTAPAAEHEAIRRRISSSIATLARASERYPQPKLWRKIPLADFGTDRNLRVGDIDGDGTNEFVLAQRQSYLGGDNACMINCLTAVRLDGEVIWQIGTPTDQTEDTTADLCFQVHDIDGDGRAEVIYTSDLQLRIADGTTGETIASVPTPEASPPASAGAYPMARILGDSLHFCDLRGAGRPQDIILKDRYTQCWAYASDLQMLWPRKCQTGHYPASCDIDGDGRDEVMMGYTLLSPEGEVLWELDTFDHADSIVVGPLREGGPTRIALAGSDAGFFLLDTDGTTLRHHPIGHAQTICVAKLLADVDGLQIAVNTYWGEPGITLILDADGEVLHEFEPMHYACLLQPVNWTNDGTDLLLLSAHPVEGGMIDGRGRRVVMFPDDGHPVLCADVRDIDGDGLDEVLAWDRESIWIYKPDPPPDRGPAGYPTRNPWFNDSNYRGQYSYPPSWAH